MSNTRLTTDQYADGSITGAKLIADISIPSITSGSSKVVHGAGLTKNGSPLTSVNGLIIKYSNVDLMHIDENGDAYIKGNLLLGGTIDSVTTTVSTLEVADNEIILNAGTATPYVGGAKITVDRGGSNYDPYIAWDESTDYWKLYDGVGTARLIDQTYGDTRYALLSGSTINGDITVGSTSRAANSFVRVLSADGYNSGFEAYGNSQGTGYLFVGQNTTYGGGMFYNGDGTPVFATGESTDYICLYRVTNGAKNVVIRYPHDSNDVTFMGDITVTGNKITLGSGSTIDNETDGMLKIKGDGEAYIYASSGATSGLQITSTFFGCRLESESYSRAIIQYADGKIGFGPGTVTRDTWLYRDAVNSLKTDGLFTAVGNFSVPNGGSFRVNNEWVIGRDTGGQIHIGSESAPNDITFCSGTGPGLLFIKNTGNVGINNTNPQYKLDVNGNGHFTGNLVVDGTITGLITLPIKYARITYPAGKSVATFTHNTGSTGYIVQITPNSAETHFYYSNLTANTVDICLDDPAYEELIVDVAIIQTSSITAITATV